MNAADLRPDISAAYSHAWKRLWKYFLELFLVFIIAMVIDNIPSFWIKPPLGFGYFAGWIYTMLIGGPISFGLAYAYLKAARDEKVEVKDVFAAFSNYWNAVLASLLAGIIIGIGFLLLIVPGIYLACKLAFTPYLVVDRKMEVTEAIRASWQMTDGHGWTIFGIGLLAIPIAIAGMIVFLVGVIPASMWITLTLASMYHAVSLTRPAVTAETGG